MSFILPAWFGIDVLVSVYYSLLWHATTLVSFSYTWSVLPTKRYWLLYSDWSTSYLIRALIPYHSHLLLLLNHVLLLLNYVVLRALWKIDVHLISTLVNKSLYYYHNISTHKMWYIFLFCSVLFYIYFSILFLCLGFCLRNETIVPVFYRWMKK